MPMDMDVMSSHNGFPSSALNPNAPMFVPAAYRNVEDFSDQWWSLVHSSPSFRDYWLRECFSESQFDLNNCFEFDDCEEDEDLVPVDGETQDEEERERGVGIGKELIVTRVSSWRKARGMEPRKMSEKAPKIVNVKVSPRPIHQPR